MANENPEINTSKGTDEKPNSFFAICAHSSHGPSGWTGSLRGSRSEAQADANSHNQANPGHSATVG